MAANTTKTMPELNVEVMMLIANELIENDFDDLKGIIRALGKVPPASLQKCRNFLQLWSELEQRELIKGGNYSFLEGCLRTLGKKQLANQVKEYQVESMSIRSHGSENIGQAATSSSQQSGGPCFSSQMQDLDCYKMSSDPRGLCIIINNVKFRKAPGGKKLETRDGSDVDAGAIDTLFKELKFKVITYTDRSSSEIMDDVKDISRRDHTHYDCLVFFILSHGSENGVFGADGIEVNIRDIYNSFGGDRCPTLREKPKLFFIQSCRGEARQESFSTDGQVQMDGHSLPALVDFLFGYATPAGLVSYRNKRTGTWYIRTFLEIVKRDCDKPEHDLLRILTKVNAEVSKKTVHDKYGEICQQIPMPQYSLRKNVFLKTH